VYDAALARKLRAHFDEVRDASREVTLAWLRRRPLLLQLRDSVLWLFSPYL
jgi:cardiolipin synthase